MLGLFDYPQIIKKPMDLGTVKKKMSSKQYKTLHDCAQDVRLVWNNCMTYNADGSEFFVLAQELSKKWEDKYTKLTNDLQISATTSATAASKTPSKDGGAAPSSSSSSSQQVVSLEDKKTFARNLYKISKEELGKILVELDVKSPAALVKNHAEDECEINIDNIKPSVFYELVKYVESCISSGSSASGGAGSGGGASSSGGPKKKKSKSSKKQKTG
mmetsp:Transcript_3849/g.5565  ORF Transcript_3849/g.5565 Transcript_3849/m.5565 type:complete len:216 (-) Transcript_3849:256-903(-)